MGEVRTTSTMPHGLVPGVNRWLGKSYKEFPEEFTKFCTRISSERQYEEFVDYIGFGPAVAKPETQNLTFDVDKEGWVTRIYNITLALGFQVSMEAMQDNRWGPKVQKSGKALARSFRWAEETMAGLLLSRAFNSSFVGADGVELCSTAHVNKYDGTTYSNELATPLDMSELALEQLCTLIDTQTNERGDPIMVRPKMLIIHPNDEFETTRVLRSALQADSANNALNALKALGKFPAGFMVSHYMSAGDGAFFATTDGDEGLVYVDRMPFTPDENQEFSNKNAQFSAVRRLGVGWLNPRHFYGSAGMA